MKRGFLILRDDKEIGFEWDSQYKFKKMAEMTSLEYLILENY